MQIYCGIDIIEVDRIKAAIENTSGFKEKIFTKEEIKIIERIGNLNNKYQRYAGKFAAKEAIYKAMSKLLIENEVVMKFNNVEIFNVEELRNRPRVRFLDEKLKKICEVHKIEIDVSISHINTNATAMAVVKIDKE